MLSTIMNAVSSVFMNSSQPTLSDRRTTWLFSRRLSNLLRSLQAIVILLCCLESSRKRKKSQRPSLFKRLERDITAKWHFFDNRNSNQMHSRSVALYVLKRGTHAFCTSHVVALYFFYSYHAFLCSLVCCNPKLSQRQRCGRKERISSSY